MENCYHAQQLLVNASAPKFFKTVLEPFVCDITQRPCHARDQAIINDALGTHEAWTLNPERMYACPAYNAPDNAIVDLRDYLRTQPQPPTKWSQELENMQEEVRQRRGKWPQELEHMQEEIRQRRES